MFQLHRPAPTRRSTSAQLLRPLTLGLACLASLCLPVASQTASPASATAASSPQAADHIVAIVNSEPITHNEVMARSQQVLNNIRQQGGQGQALPSLQTLAPEVLERLIDEKVQEQRALETGIRVDDFAIEQALATIAAQNGGSLEDLRAELRNQGISEASFRRNLRQQILAQRLREREVDSRVRVSEQEIDQHLAQQSQASAQGNAPAQALNLGHILVAVPENASPAAEQELRQRAEQALQALRSGVDLRTTAQRYSDAGEPEMGLRPAQRYPEAFLHATATTPVGGVAGPFRSPAGFHILIVLEKSAGATQTITQHHARHILLRPSAQLSERQAAEQLAELRQRIERGTASFATLAQEFSQDGSAAMGGDLGWANPGQFVPEFEQVLEQLQPGEISQPVVSRFGVHLIELLERRQAELNAQEQRELLRQQVRAEKLEKAYATWLQELRGQAYVEYRNQQD